MIDVLERISIVAGSLLGTFAVLALIGRPLVRRMFLPWLREHLLDPVRATNDQLTINQHVSRTPTVLDRIDTMSRNVIRVEESADGAALAARAAAKVIEKHIASSERDRTRLWEHVRKLEEDRDR